MLRNDGRSTEVETVSHFNGLMWSLTSMEA